MKKKCKICESWNGYLDQCGYDPVLSEVEGNCGEFRLDRFLRYALIVVAVSLLVSLC